MFEDFSLDHLQATPSRSAALLLLVFFLLEKVAQKIGAKIVAEFVADGEILAAAKELEVDYLQGCYFGRSAASAKRIIFLRSQI